MTYEEYKLMRDDWAGYEQREEPYEMNDGDEFIADFLASSQELHLNIVNGSIYTGLSDNYGNYAFDGTEIGRKSGGSWNGPGYYDAARDAYITEDGRVLRPSVTYGEMTAIEYQISAGGDWYGWNTNAPVSEESFIVNSGSAMTHKEALKFYEKLGSPVNYSIPITKEAFISLLNTNADIKKALAATAKNQTTMIGYDLMRRESGLVIGMDKAGGIHVSTLVYGPWELVGSADAASVSFANGIKWAESNGWTVIAGVHSHPNDNLFYASGRDRGFHDYNNVWGVVMQQGDSSSGILIDPSNGKTSTIKFSK